MRNALIGIVVGIVAAVAVTASARLKPEHESKFADLVAAQHAVEQVSAPARAEVAKLRELGDYAHRLAGAAEQAVSEHRPERAIRLLTDGRKVLASADDVCAAALKALRAIDDGKPEDADGGVYPFVSEPPFRSANAPR